MSTKSGRKKLPLWSFPTQVTQAADLPAGLVPIYSRPARRPTGARYFKNSGSALKRGRTRAYTDGGKYPPK